MAYPPSLTSRSAPVTRPFTSWGSRPWLAPPSPAGLPTAAASPRRLRNRSAIDNGCTPCLSGAVGRDVPSQCGALQAQFQVAVTPRVAAPSGRLIRGYAWSGPAGRTWPIWHFTAASRPGKRARLTQPEALCERHCEKCPKVAFAWPRPRKHWKKRKKRLFPLSKPRRRGAKVGPEYMSIVVHFQLGVDTLWGCSIITFSTIPRHAESVRHCKQKRLGSIASSAPVSCADWGRRGRGTRAQ